MNAPEMGALLQLGESLPTKGRVARVTALDLEGLPRLRGTSISLAPARGTTTSSDAKDDAGLPRLSALGWQTEQRHPSREPIRDWESVLRTRSSLVGG